MAQFAVMGLGRFGSAASQELIKLGHSVLGVDMDNKLVAKYADELTRAVIADVTDKHALEELGVDNYDVVLVAVGTDIQTSLLCVVHLKSLGVKTIWVKASSHAHHLILNKLGVDRIIHPEEEMGIRIAQALSYPMVEDYISLGNGEFIVEIHVSEQLDGAPIGRFLRDTPSPLHVLMVKRRADITVHPPMEFEVHGNDVLVLLGQLNALKAIAPKLA
ncbi:MULTISPECIES: potassium channel family protein [Pusillimonas]|uniref:potassium channel family protein n=1 Tax=Pusillimonas TaxID=305976 RepID=UPI000E5A099B|nr:MULTISPECIES: TrkA family potassium uptake protein [Pusillimonas]MDX3893302.1 TrkA family potassium uptake protein [Pusillimonas sp.]TFL10054.1 TrkA family potassium uptake protein [Pusillimonas caeni]